MHGELHEVIAKLWDDARPRLLARVEALEAAAAGPGDPTLHDKAVIEAHTLIGTLGSFGRTGASETARAAEDALTRHDDEALARCAASLRAEIEA